MDNKSRESHFDYIELPTKNREGLKKAKSFYSSVFGWSFKDWGDEYADTGDSGVASGLNGDPSQAPPYPLVILYAQNIEAKKKEIATAGGKITRDIFAFPGGRRFHFTDPTGNELGIWSDK